MLCMPEFTTINGEVVTGTSDCHPVFAKLPCKGQLRLAIVVAAGFYPFVVGGSFSVTGRSCAIDVCWEVKKFRVICSHQPLERDACAHQRILTGLVPIPSRPHSANVGSAKTFTHRVEKPRMLESFIMENLLTATNTFHSEDNGITNIYTCNYHGNHEPQQIDYILSSDNNLRSRVF